MSLEVGAVVVGKVSGITNFGAFVDFEDGQTGLIHISEVAREYVKDISEHLSVGQEVRVKVMSIDERGKVSLSIKKALEETRTKKYVFSGRPAEISFSNDTSELSFEDMMSKFKQDSDDKMQSIKRNIDSKRSSYKRSSGSF